MSEALIPVPFRADTLYIVNFLDQPVVPMKPVAEAMGLAWEAQRRKLAADQRYDHMVIPLHSPGGVQDTLCIPLRKLNGWLFSINPAKVAAHLRDTVLAYQEECFQALYEYWHTGVAERRPPDDEDTGDLESLAAPPRSRFASLDPGIMRELRLLNPRLVQAYLVDHGITPIVVDTLLNGRTPLPAGLQEHAHSTPLEVIASRIATVTTHEDHEAWYLERHQWLQLCHGYDARITALWLRDLGILRTNDGRLTLRGSPLMFNGERPTVFCILKSLLAAPYIGNNKEAEGRRAHG